MNVALIITTYNRPEALELVLLSAFRQRRLPDEILVADDGSTEETGRLLETLKAQSPVPLYHVWQEDEGFRAARIRNKAIARSSADLLILIDGDMVLDEFFVADHVRFSHRHTFNQGGRVKSGGRQLQRMVAEKSPDFSFFTPDIGNRKNTLRIPFMTRLLAGAHTRMRGVRLCNFAAWREDLYRVNGFNEEFVGWGREDSELVVRLFNSGVKRQDLKFSALALHLYHPERSRASLPRNDRLLEEAIRSRSVWCDKGLDQYGESENA